MGQEFSPSSCTKWSAAIVLSFSLEPVYAPLPSPGYMVHSSFSAILRHSRAHTWTRGSSVVTVLIQQYNQERKDRLIHKSCAVFMSLQQWVTESSLKAVTSTDGESESLGRTTNHSGHVLCVHYTRVTSGTPGATGSKISLWSLIIVLFLFCFALPL